MIRVPCPQTQLPTTRCSNPIIVGAAISRPPYLPLAFVGADDFCCGARNLCAALTAASNFDRCHSFLLAVSATGGARKRPVRPYSESSFRVRRARRLCRAVLSVCEADTSVIHYSPFTVHCFYQWADRVVRPYSGSAFMVVGHDHWACRVFESVCEADTSVIHYSLFTFHCSLLPTKGTGSSAPTRLLNLKLYRAAS